MNKNIISLLLFTLGLGVGFGSGYYFIRNKYEKKIATEIDSIKNSFEKYYKDKNKVTKKVESDSNIAVNKPEVAIKVENTNPETKYKNYAAVYDSGIIKDKTKKKSISTVNTDIKDSYFNNKNPYVITPVEFDRSVYQAVTLFYYLDNIVSDSDGSLITDHEKLIGNDFMHHFGEYEEDSVYIRNDEKKIDYEILIKNEDYYSTHSTKNFVIDDEN